MSREDLKKIGLGVVVGVLLASGASVFAVWNEPTAAPTAGNPSAPINVGNAGQSKGGNIVVNANNQYQNGLLVSFGALVVGDSSPETGSGLLKLDVEGKTGSTQFCDESGTQCFTVANLCAKVADLCQ